VGGTVCAAQHVCITDSGANSPDTMLVLLRAVSWPRICTATAVSRAAPAFSLVMVYARGWLRCEWWSHQWCLHCHHGFWGKRTVWQLWHGCSCVGTHVSNPFSSGTWGVWQHYMHAALVVHALLHPLIQLYECSILCINTTCVAHFNLLSCRADVAAR
jgi:hypothetical protein